MKKNFGLLFTCLLMPLTAVETIPLTPGPGVEIFLESAHRCDYWRLINYFETQVINSYCGVASSVMVLNAMEIDKPFVERLKHPLFTQEEGFFTPEVQEVVKPDEVLKRGMTLPELAEALETFEVSVTPLYASDISLDAFRELLQNVLVREKQFLIANFFRPLIGQSGGGHFSPVAAYNKQTDHVLILDVSRYKHPPFWVKAEDLYTSMLVADTGSEKARGLLLISAKTS